MAEYLDYMEQASPFEDILEYLRGIIEEIGDMLDN